MITHIIGDENSQTGIAVRKRYNTELSNSYSTCDFNSITEAQLSRNTFDGVYPIWNSNCGYVTASKLEATIFNHDIELEIKDIWIKKIDFYQGYIQSTPNKPTTSVTVAKYQCSNWLKQHHFFDSFVPAGTTTIAINNYNNDMDKYSSVLCTSKQISVNNLSSDNVSRANPFNYTTFIRSTNNKLNHCRSNYIIATLKLPTFKDTRSKEFSTFFGELCEDIESISELPKVLFAINLGGDNDGIIMEIDSKLLESAKAIIESYSVVSDFESEDTIGSLIDNIYLTRGHTNNSLINESIEKLNKYFENTSSYFFKYIPNIPPKNSEGKDLDIPAFYAIPKLNIIIQGYDESIIKNLAIESIRNFENIADDKPELLSTNELVIHSTIKSLRKHKPGSGLGNIIDFIPIEL